MSENKLPCEIVEDLLPSYVDGLTSNVTNRTIREHLENCENCSRVYRSMTAPETNVKNEEIIEVDYLKKNRKRTVLKIVLGVLGALFLTFGYLIFASFKGSLIQKARYTRLAKAYVEENYPNRGYLVDRATYDFKRHGYYCIVYSPESEDNHFCVYPENGKGDLTDDYDYSVGRLNNTRNRLPRELDTAVDGLFTDFPFRTRLMLTGLFGQEERSAALYLDMPLDLKTLPESASFIAWIETDNEAPTWEELEEKLVQVRDYVESKGISMGYYSLYLEYPYFEEENGELMPLCYDANISVFDVPASAIDDPAELHRLIEEARINTENELKEMEKGE